MSNLFKAGRLCSIAARGACQSNSGTVGKKAYHKDAKAQSPPLIFVSWCLCGKTSALDFGLSGRGSVAYPRVALGCSPTPMARFSASFSLDPGRSDFPGTGRFVNQYFLYPDETYFKEPPYGRRAIKDLQLSPWIHPSRHSIGSDGDLDPIAIGIQYNALIVSIARVPRTTDNPETILLQPCGQRIDLFLGPNGKGQMAVPREWGL